MANSNITITNDALTKLGVSNRITAMTDDTEEAKAANQIFTDVVEDILAEHDWNFAIGQTELIRARKTITGITAATPPVVTSASHGFSDGDTVIIEDVVGMTEVNGVKFKVASGATNTFELTDHQDVDIVGASYTAYSSGGKVMPAPIFRYAYKFSLPSDYLRMIEDYNEYEFQIENGFVVTDESEPQFYYIKNVTDYTLISPKFREALIARLAFELSMVLKGSGSMRDRLESEKIRALRKAKRADALEGTSPTLPDGSWLDARLQ